MNPAPAPAPSLDEVEILLQNDPVLLENYRVQRARHRHTQKTLADILEMYDAAGFLSEQAPKVLAVLRKER